MAQKRRERMPLQMPRSEAEALIRRQIEKGQKLLGLKIRFGDKAAAEQAHEEEKKWLDFNLDLLKSIVNTDKFYVEYTEAHNRHVPDIPTDSFWANYFASVFVNFEDYFYPRVKSCIVCLESILNRLDMIPELPATSQPVKEQTTDSHSEISKRVFIVHGHDEEAKQSVARCLEKVGLEAIVLHEKPSRGRTIIEKFEGYADVGFAIILLTPDDVCVAKADMDNPKPRARQNVIFELGFFIGKLGRDRVCALHKGDVEIPSDIAGVVWVPMDPGGAWRFELVREMRAAGLDVDPNKLL